MGLGVAARRSATLASRSGVECRAGLQWARRSVRSAQTAKPSGVAAAAV